MQIEFNAQQRRDYGPDEVNRLITEYLVEKDMNDIHQKTEVETSSGFKSLSYGKARHLATVGLMAKIFDVK